MVSGVASPFAGSSTKALKAELDIHCGKRWVSLMQHTGMWDNGLIRAVLSEEMHYSIKYFSS